MNIRILQLVLVVQFVLVAHLTLAHPIKNNTWICSQFAEALIKRKHKQNWMLWSAYSFNDVASECVLTAGPGMPRRPSGPDLPGCPWGPTGPVFPTGPWSPVVPYRAEEQTGIRKRTDQRGFVERQRAQAQSSVPVIILTLAPFMPCLPSFPAAPIWPWG